MNAIIVRSCERGRIRKDIVDIVSSVTFEKKDASSNENTTTWRETELRGGGGAGGGAGGRGERRGEKRNALMTSTTTMKHSLSSAKSFSDDPPLFFALVSSAGAKRVNWMERASGWFPFKFINGDL